MNCQLKCATFNTFKLQLLLPMNGPSHKPNRNELKFDDEINVVCQSFINCVHRNLEITHTHTQ